MRVVVKSKRIPKKLEEEVKKLSNATFQKLTAFYFTTPAQLTGSTCETGKSL